MKNIKIGFIGQGFIGKNYANDLEKRGYSVIRYAKEKALIKNKGLIKDCDLVFIAVPTPTTTKGFDSGIIRSVIPLTGVGKIVVIKSTILPGVTKSIQNEYPDRIILHSPEFLSEATAAYDAGHPFINIVGTTDNTTAQKQAAKIVLSVLPKTKKNMIVKSEEAELIKYTHNCSGYFQIIFFNLMYDLSQKMNADWANIKEAVKSDPFIPNRYSSPIHKSGRGAGGHCFIKDFAALNGLYKKIMKDPLGKTVLSSIEKKNIELLKQSNKDINLLNEVYGKNI